MNIIILIPVQKKIDQHLVSLKKNTISIIENQINRKISYSSISPSLFMYLEFRDFSIMDKNKELININRIRVYYNFRKLISGDIMNSLKEIRIVNSELAFDDSVDKDLWTQFLVFLKSGEKNTGLPDLKISGKNLKISIKKGDNSLNVSKFFFLLSHKDNKTVFSSKGNVHFYSSKLNEFKTKMLVTGSLKDNSEITNTVLVLKSIDTKYFNMDKLSVNISYKDGQFQLLKVDDDRPMDLKLIYLVEDKSLKVEFNSESFIPNEYITQIDIDPVVSQWLGTSISGSAGINYNLLDRNIEYSADIKIKTNNKKLPVQAAINTSFVGDKDNISFSGLNIKTIDGGLFFKGNVDCTNWLPTGRIAVSCNLTSFGIKANLAVKSTNNSLHLESSNLSINNVLFEKFETDISLFSKDLDFNSSLSLSDNKQLETGLIQINGNLQHSPDLFLNVTAKTKKIPLNIIALNSIPKAFRSYLDIIPKLDLSTEVFLTTDFSQFSFSAPEVAIHSTLNNISFSVSGNNESINLDNIDAEINQKNLSGSIKVNKSKQSVNSTVSLSYAGVPYSLNLEYFPERALFFDGMYGLMGSVYKDRGISKFEFEVSKFPFIFKENTADFSLKTSGLFNNFKDWELNINNLALENVPGLVSENLLNLKGSVTNSKISLVNIKYSDPLSTLIGSGDFDYNLTNERKINGYMNLKSNDGESYNGEVSFKDNSIKLLADFHNAALDRIQRIPVSGFVDGNLSLEGELPVPKLNMSIQLNKGEYKSSPLELETAMELTGEKILLNYMRLKYRNQVLQKGNGEYNLKNGEMFFNSEYTGTIKDKIIKSSIEIKGKTELKGSGISLQNLPDSNYIAKISILNILVNNKVFAPWDFNIEQKNNNIVFFGGPSGSISGIIKNKENFDITLKTGLPLRGHAIGSILNNNLDIKLNNIEVDLALVNYIPLGDFFEFQSGAAKGDLNISGKTDAPLFNGKLEAIAAKANVHMVPDEIEPFDTDIIFKDREVSIGPEILYTSNASTKVGFKMLFNKWSISNYKLDINSMGEQGIHIIYSEPSIGIGMDGYITGKFTLEGDNTASVINGDLLADDCIITLDPVQDIASDIDIPLLLDIKFTSGKKVQFLWPSETLPILRATANQGQVININMDSLNDTYSVIGDVGIKYGSIYYFQKSFYLSEGSISFKENESKFDPLLGFRAQIKEVDTSGQIVNITLIQDKLPISKFSPRFESDPPLSDVEIFSMLGSGVFATIGNEQFDLTSALVLTGDLVTRFGFIQSFENKVKDVFKLDLFSIRTQVIQNILIDKFVDNSTTDNGVYLDSFGRYLDNTNLYLGKYFGNDIFLQGQLQISNQKVLDSGLLYASNKLFFESTISLEWKTPLFLLGFSIKPDFVDPLASIQNTSLALSWGYSY